MVRQVTLAMFGVALLVQLVRAQATQPATQPSVALDLSSVSFDWGTPDWKPKVEGTAPLIVTGGSVFARNSLCYEYASALRGHSYAGTRFVLGYLGGPFPDGAAVVPETFERKGDQIRLVLRYDDKPTNPPKRQGNLCFFGAMLDDDLPDGTYTVTVELRDTPAHLELTTTQRLTFQKPDPRLVRAREEFAQAKTLSAAELFDRYRKQAAEMKGIGAPREGRFIGTTPLDTADDDSERLRMLKAEIIRRGTDIGPLLIEALKEQAVRNPDVAYEWASPPLGMAYELMDMLTQIGDARAAPMMVDILSGKLRCNRFVQLGALEHIEKLTLVRFRRFAPHITSYADAVRGPDAIIESMKTDARSDGFRQIATMYERWLSDHPAKDADSTPWAKEAVRLARIWLEGEDLSEAYNAATFLRSGRHHKPVMDDDPARTTRRIASILQQCELKGSSNADGFAYYTYRYKPTGEALPVTIHNWADLLTNGPSVPAEYAPLLIRLEREMPDYPGAMARYLMKVGGAEAMTYRVEAYQRLLDQVNKSGADPRTDISTLKDRKLQPLIWNTQLHRWGIERWAGRTFPTDKDLDDWWSSEKGKSQQQWLETGLPITAARADAGDQQSQYLLRLMLGTALPGSPTHFVWMQPGWHTDPPPRPEEGEPFRAKWVADRASALRCDVEKGAFVLKQDP